MRRGISMVAALAVGAMALTACSSGSNSAKDDGPVTINYWLWDSLQQPAYQECADDFTKANPNIKIKISQYGWDDYWTTLRNNFVSNTAPDVFTDHVTWYPQFVSQGLLLDIEDKVKEDKVDLGQYQDGLADLWVGKDGGRFGLPKDWDTVGLFYNVDMVTKAGYKAADLQNLAWNPTDGGTYEKLIAHLTVDKNGKRGDEPGFDKKNVATYGLGLATSGAGFGQVENAAYTLSNDWDYADKNPWGTKLNYSDPKYKETIKWWRSLISKGYMPTLQVAQSSDGTKDPFAAGKYAMITEGDWNANSFATIDGVKTAFAPSPIGPSGKRASVFNGLADSIWKGTKHPDQSWEWVKYLGSPSCQNKVAEKAVVFPAIKSATTKAFDAFKAKGMDMSAFTVQVDEKTTHLPPITEHWGDVLDILTPTMDSIMSFKEDVGALDKANQQVNDLFK